MEEAAALRRRIELLEADIEVLRGLLTEALALLPNAAQNDAVMLVRRLHGHEDEYLEHLHQTGPGRVHRNDLADAMEEWRTAILGAPWLERD